MTDSEKAALWDALVARIEAGAWVIETFGNETSGNTVAIQRVEIEELEAGKDDYISLLSPVGEGATLAEAVTKAMEAEGAK